MPDIAYTVRLHLILYLADMVPMLCATMLKQIVHFPKKKLYVIIKN